MNSNFINTGILAAAFLSLFGFAEILYHRYKVKAELTRKIVHVGTGLLTLLFPLMLSNHWWVLFLCASFALILLLSLKFHFLPSINAIDRESAGSLAYPVSVYAAFLFYDLYDKHLVYFYLPILILAISDPVAALVGKKWPWGEYKMGADKKTLAGSIGFLISAFAVCVTLLVLLSGSEPISLGRLVIKSFGLALAGSIAEGITSKGYDNIAIPLAILGTLIAFEYT